jgi:pterin-4a-carbinolamine dehydratase
VSVDILILDMIMSQKEDKHQSRKQMPVYTGVIKYFPNALKYVSKVSLAGNNQHHPDKELHWDKSKSTDHLDALTRHLIDADKIDDDGLLHLGKVAWRALAALEDYIEKSK